MATPDNHENFPLRIELNRPALERLIGGRSEMEVALREQIVREFTRRHLKELVNTEPVRQAIQVIQNEIAGHVARIVEEIRRGTPPTPAQSTGWWDLRRLVATAAEKLLTETVEKTIKGEVERQMDGWKSIVQQKVNLAVNREIDVEVARRVRDGIGEKLKAMTEAADAAARSIRAASN